jgi:hypothetical protein
MVVLHAHIFFDPPVRLRSHPERVIRTLYDAQRCVEALGTERGGHDWQDLLNQLPRSASEKADREVALNFKAWLQAENLLDERSGD